MADKSLVDSKLFYPREANTAEARLRHYSDNFRLVEVDSSYYALPAPPVAELWAQRTPDTFVFDIKAFRIFTQHQIPPKVLPADIREALGSLAEKARMAGPSPAHRSSAQSSTLSELAFGKDAKADCYKVYRYDRDVCTVYVNGQDVGLARLDAGLAWWFRTYAHEQPPKERIDYEAAEDRAAADRTGLWQDKNPVPPWEWRHTHR